MGILREGVGPPHRSIGSYEASSLLQVGVENF